MDTKLEKMSADLKEECAKDVIRDVNEMLKVEVEIEPSNLNLLNHLAYDIEDKARVMRDDHGYDVSTLDMISIVTNYLHDYCVEELGESYEYINN
tara:strand:+ start:2629 stop:2913 length:285 start_codon:yes stop_codon:yes gene_type:complete